MTDQQSFLQHRLDVLIDEFLTMLGCTNDNKHEFEITHIPWEHTWYVHRGQRHAGKFTAKIRNNRLKATFEVAQNYDPDQYATNHQDASDDATEPQKGQPHE